MISPSLLDMSVGLSSREAKPKLDKYLSVLFNSLILSSLAFSLYPYEGGERGGLIS